MLSGAIIVGAGRSLRRKLLAALGAAIRKHFAAADRGHARPKAMATLTDQLRGLVGALQRRISGVGAAANGRCRVNWNPA
jgi:hypothetical protein